MDLMRVYQLLSICAFHQGHCVGASIQVRVRRNGDNNLFPFKAFFHVSDVGKRNPKRVYLSQDVHISNFFFFSWDKLHWMMQNLIHIALSTICFLWLKILKLLVRESGKNRKAMHNGSACRSILNDNHFLIQLGP